MLLKRLHGEICWAIFYMPTMREGRWLGDRKGAPLTNANRQMFN